MLSYGATYNQNKLYYLILSDGITASWAVKGKPDGPPWYLVEAMLTSNIILQGNSQQWDAPAQSIKITSLLLIRNCHIDMAMTLKYANGTRSMEVCSIVHMNENISDNTTTNTDAWCTNLVYQFVNFFCIMRLAFRGNADNFDMNKIESLDKIFLSQDVANLAILSYVELIRDHSFFSDIELFSKYFTCTLNVSDAFRDLFRIQQAKLVDFQCKSFN